MTSIFDIAGVTATQEQRRQQNQGSAQIGRTFEDVARQQMVANEDLSMSMPTSVSPTISGGYTMPQSFGGGISEKAKEAYLQTIQSRVQHERDLSNQAYQDQQNRQRALVELNQRLSNPNLGDQLGASFLRGQFENLANPLAKVVYDNAGNYAGVSAPLGLFGGMVYSGNPDFDPAKIAYEQKFGKSEDERREVVLPETDESTGAKRCPDGYVFDEQLQACRLATTIPNMPTTTDRTAFYQQPYQPMGLLDQDGYEYGVPLIYG